MMRAKQKTSKKENRMKRLIRKTRKLFNTITNAEIRFYSEYLKVKEVNPIDQNEVIED